MCAADAAVCVVASSLGVSVSSLARFAAVRFRPRGGIVGGKRAWGGASVGVAE